MTGSVIDAVDVAVAVGGREILRGVSVSVAPGEVLGLIGPNGAGKSTLLSVLAGDLSPTRGRALLMGREYAAYSAREAARLRAVMLQNPAVSFAPLVRDVVEMGRSAHRRDREVDADVVDACLRQVDLLALQDREVTTLSGGERARVALARVMAQQASVVLLDEPTAAMDVGHQERTMRTVRGLAAGGVGVIIVLHDLNTAARYCDRLALLGDGGLAGVGSPDEICTEELLSAVYDWPVAVSRHDEADVEGTVVPQLWIRPRSAARPGAGSPPFG